MGHFAVAAVGGDRPGIAAAVSKVLFEHGCNLEDTSMSILRGHFAMMLIVYGPDELGADRLEAALAEPAADLDLVVSVRAIDDTVPASPDGQTWSVAVYGSDRPGIVYQVTQLLADEEINVTGLTTRVIGDETRPVYTMLLDVTLPPDTDVAELRYELDALAGRLGVDCSLHPADADIL